MSNATVIRFGQINGAGNTDALFLKTFGGEVLAAYEEATVTKGMFMERQMQSGISAQFPATWKIPAAYHTPGTEILGSTSNSGERIINVDELLLASVFLARIEEAKSHYDVRSIYSTETGRALAYREDANLLQLGILAARASATVTGGNGGTRITSVNSRTSATDLAAAIYTGAQELDENDVPEDERAVFVRPAQYYLLAQSTALINRDWGGMGSYADGKIVRIANAPIIKTNRLPQGVVASDASTRNTYSGTFTNVSALMCHKSCIGSVQLLGMKAEMAYDMRRQGTLVVASYAKGHGILRPEGAVEIMTAP
jgi:hypothetical protein